MSNVLPALNELIARIARREIRAESRRTKKVSSRHRKDIAALKRTIRVLASRVVSLERGGGKPIAPLASASADAEGIRFRRDGMRTHRQKIGLSAKDYGRLLGVSPLTVYHWETGKSKPRRKHFPAIAAVRAMGKKEAQRVLSGAK